MWTSWLYVREDGVPSWLGKSMPNPLEYLTLSPSVSTVLGHQIGEAMQLQRVHTPRQADGSMTVRDREQKRTTIDDSKQSQDVLDNRHREKACHSLTSAIESVLKIRPMYMNASVQYSKGKRHFLHLVAQRLPTRSLGNVRPDRRSICLLLPRPLPSYPFHASLCEDNAC
ncbi:hypothetical protein AC1031_007806 [Aphanomyces cochlioides]|nr:hypothetical protein AC1031_007806 [Aphanomyces cochlioides]